MNNALGLGPRSNAARSRVVGLKVIEDNHTASASAIQNRDLSCKDRASIFVAASTQSFYRLDKLTAPLRAALYDQDAALLKSEGEPVALNNAGHLSARLVQPVASLRNHRSAPATGPAQDARQLDLFSVEEA